jgi:hypothetical protein
MIETFIPKYEPEIEAALKKFHRGVLPLSKAQAEAIKAAKVRANLETDKRNRYDQA